MRNVRDVDTTVTSRTLLAGELQKIVYAGFLVVREVGDVQSVASHLRDPLLSAYGKTCPKAAARIAEAHEWLAVARDHEALHGHGTTADKAHPLWAPLERARLIGLESLRAREAAAV